MIAHSKASLVRYAMLIVAILCQLATVAITWPLWQTRVSPVNLPSFSGLPEISFGWAMVGSLLLAAVRPKLGVPVHWLVLVVACMFDQFRLEPQFFGLAVLMLAYFDDVGLRFCRWYLVAMWIWTGLHKFLSPDWMGHISWSLLTQAGLPPARFYWFAAVIAATEVTLGLLACFRPRWASRLCVVVHLGIVVFLSPLLTGMNPSVIPWNLAIACVGYWVLRRAGRQQTETNAPLPRWEAAMISVLMLIPLGFYVGWVDRCFCHVMYSGCLPRAMISTKTGSRELNDYQESTAVPFPRERRLLRLYFSKTAQTGDKLHIADPRSRLSDQYFVMRTAGAKQISRNEFYGVGAQAVAGVGIDDKRSLFALSQAGVRMLRESEHSPVYAVAFTPENFDRALLGYLRGLPNLVQIQFAGTDINNQDLQHLTELRLLTGLGLNHTAITDEGLSQLDDLPYIRYFETEGTSIKDDR